MSIVTTFWEVGGQGKHRYLIFPSLLSDGSSAASPVTGTGENWLGDVPAGQKPAGERHAPSDALQARHNQDEAGREPIAVEAHPHNSLVRYWLFQFSSHCSYQQLASAGSICHSFPSPHSLLRARLLLRWSQ